MKEEIKKEIYEYSESNAEFPKSIYWKYIEELKLLLRISIKEDGRKLSKKKIYKYFINKYQNEEFGKYNTLISFINRNLTAERYIVKKKVVNKKLDANNKKVVKEASVDSLSKENSETQKTIARMMETDSLSKENSETQKTIARMMEVVRARNS